MAYPVGQYFIDGKDLFLVFGIVVESGSDDLLKYPERKDSESYDWQDENGVDIDLSRVFFGSREINLQCSLHAQNESDFWEKYHSFLATLAQPELRRLEVTELSSSFYVYYKNCSSFTRFTRIKRGIAAGVSKFTLTLIEKAPTIDSSNVYMITDDNRFMIT